MVLLLKRGLYRDHINLTPNPRIFERDTRSLDSKLTLNPRVIKGIQGVKTIIPIIPVSISFSFPLDSALLGDYYRGIKGDTRSVDDSSYGFRRCTWCARAYPIELASSGPRRAV